jgi:hypothetical protein
MLLKFFLAASFYSLKFQFYFIFPEKPMILSFRCLRMAIALVIFSPCQMTWGQGYDAVLVAQRTEIEVVNKTLIRKYFYKVMINNRAGEEFARIAIPYSALEKVSHLDAYITDAMGARIKKLDKNEITERSAISSLSLYEDDYVLEFALKHTTYPYTLVYSFQTEQSQFLCLDNWTPVLDGRIPTLDAKLVVKVPIGYEIAYRSNEVNAPIITKLDDQVIYAWASDYLHPLSVDNQTPSLGGYFPFVALVPVQFRFGLSGSFATWTTFGNWLNDLLEGLDDLPENEIKRIRERTYGMEESREKIRALYHDLQDETRYINISVETGGMMPFPASEVAVNKYGDCKALTNYLKSQLRCIGIESFYTLVHAGSPTQHIDTTFPSQQFNHVVLYVPLPHDTIWLDCTSRGPFNYLGTFTQNRPVFVADAGRSYFLTTPALRSSDVHEARHINIATPDDLGSAIYVKGAYRGRMFELLQELDYSHGADDQFNYIRDEIAPKGHELKRYTLSRDDRDSLYILLDYEAVASNIYLDYGDDIVVRNIPFGIPVYEKPVDRKWPLRIDCPISMSDTLVYAIPDGIGMCKTRENQVLSCPFGQYSIAFEYRGNEVVVTKHFLLYAGHYPMSEYESFYTFISTVDILEHSPHITLIKQ